jgi:hypothetical protein
MKFRILRLLFIAASVAFALSSCRNEDNKIEPTCFDEVKNQGEVGIDCGGPCPDCLPTCDDRVLNGTEQFIDCGGEDCVPCATCLDNIQNAHWKFDPNLTMADFNSNDSVGMAGGVLWRLVLERGVDCGVPCDSLCQSTCDDGIQNGDEQGVDCGGTNCPTTCFPATCGDGLQNGQETGIDCGAPGCPDCPMPTCNDGIQNTHIEYVEVTCQNPSGYFVVVETGPDCDNDFQTSCPDCPIATCFDGVQNGSETGIDCDDLLSNGCPPCDPVPACGNGYQDGAETGVDCDDDPSTICPPCATCADGIQNGPELFIDCVDWPIADYDGGACPQCESCYDGVPNGFELLTDCGGPDCEPCLQFLTASIDGSQFVDQFFFNSVFVNPCAQNAPDTLFVPNALTFGPTTGGFVNTANRKITGIQQIETANGTFQRTLEIWIPRPNNVETTDDPIPVLEFELGIVEPPTVQYSEGFLDGQFAGIKTYSSIEEDNEDYLTDPFPLPEDRVFDLITKVEISPEGYSYLVGSINFVRVEEAFGINTESFPITDIEFAIQYSFYE